MSAPRKTQRCSKHRDLAQARGSERSTPLRWPLPLARLRLPWTLVSSAVPSLDALDQQPIDQPPLNQGVYSSLLVDLTDTNGIVRRRGTSHPAQPLRASACLFRPRPVAPTDQAN